ncbi:MAG: carboxypeptidase-like regulatory domain-containing protein [Leadbetterella sp.]|nr:carboxypeptidase-like regulatory domain-containing protein [Leadbetterella sp.]
MKLYTFACLCCMVFSLNSFAQSKNVTGQVRSEAGEPLPGATVVLKNQNRQHSELTDAKGEFTLQRIDDGTYELVISFIGFEPIPAPSPCLLLKSG